MISNQGKSIKLFSFMTDPDTLSLVGMYILEISKGFAEVLS